MIIAIMKTLNCDGGVLREQYAQILVNRILALCKSRGISVNKLSEMSGVSQSTIDNLVNGKTFNPRICTLHRIALAFGMTVSEFLNFKDLNDFSFEDILDDLRQVQQFQVPVFFFCIVSQNTVYYYIIILPLAD